MEMSCVVAVRAAFGALHACQLISLCHILPKPPVKVSLLSLRWQESKQQAESDKYRRSPAVGSYTSICACSLHTDKPSA